MWNGEEEEGAKCSITITIEVFEIWLFGCPKHTIMGLSDRAILCLGGNLGLYGNRLRKDVDKSESPQSIKSLDLGELAKPTHPWTYRLYRSSSHVELTAQ
ncbi:hypothetical protein CR513_24124, partial [Mucuna pruriens]